MNASELMYFTGAPLAHIVQWQERQRLTRTMARARRAVSRGRSRKLAL